MKAAGNPLGAQAGRSQLSALPRSRAAPTPEHPRGLLAGSCRPVPRSGCNTGPQEGSAEAQPPPGVPPAIRGLSRALGTHCTAAPPTTATPAGTRALRALRGETDAAMEAPCGRRRIPIGVGSGRTCPGTTAAAQAEQPLLLQDEAAPDENAGSQSQPQPYVKAVPASRRPHGGSGPPRCLSPSTERAVRGCGQPGRHTALRPGIAPPGIARSSARS